MEWSRPRVAGASKETWGRARVVVWWKETQEEVVKAARTGSPFINRLRGRDISAPMARANPVGAGGQGSREPLSEAGNSRLLKLQHQQLRYRNSDSEVGVMESSSHL